MKRRYAMPLTVILFSIAALAIGALLIVNNARQVREAIGVELKAIATQAASHIDAGQFYRLFFQNDKLRPVLKDTAKSAEFFQIRKRLADTAALYSELNLGENNIYTFVRDLKNDELRWGVMLHPQPFTGELYLPPQALLNVLAYGKPGFSGVYLSSASKREWISGYAPIVHRSQVVGIVEVAREVTEVARIARLRLVPVLIAGFAVLALAVFAILLLLNSGRRLNQANSDLQQTLAELGKSTSTYRTLTESSTDIIFSLDADFRVLSLNRAAHRQLGIDNEAARGRDIVDVLCSRGGKSGENLFDPALLRRALANLRERNDTVNMSAALMSGLTGEPREYRIRVERVEAGGSVGYIGRASGQGETAVAGLIARPRLSFRLMNSVIMTEELAAFLAGLCRRYLDDNRATTFRIMLREMLLNAIEHGNLEIDFEAKSRALATDSYFELIDERRRIEPYRDRLVTVDALIDPEKIAFRITDEGPGFDHGAMLAKLQGELNVAAHGRGILMTLQEFDIVRYNRKGNSVLLLKKISV
jgi:PAS domain-containing protein